MGNKVARTFSTVGRTVGSAFRNGNSFNPRDHNIEEFYPEIGRRNLAGFNMFKEINPSEKGDKELFKFKNKVIFNNIDDVNKILQDYGVNDNRYNKVNYDLLKIFMILELFKCSNIGYTTNDDYSKNSEVFNKLSSIKDKFYDNLNLTEKTSQISSNFKTKDFNDFKIYINDLKKSFTILNIFEYIINYYHVLIAKVEFEIKYYGGDSSLTYWQKKQRYLGCFTAITRSGFNYKETESFLKFYLKNKIKTNLSAVDEVLKRYKYAISNFNNDIINGWKLLACPIKEGITDSLVIKFDSNNSNTKISIGNNNIYSLNSLREDIKHKISSNNIANFEIFLIQTGDDLSNEYNNSNGVRFLFLSDNKFIILPESTIYRYLGFRQSGLYESKSNSNTGKQFLISELALSDEYELADTKDKEEMESIKSISTELASFCSDFYRPTIMLTEKN
jgi:hypothetical protein